MTLLRTSIAYGDSSYPHYYLCPYLPVSAGRDTLSHSLLKFKLGRQPDLNGWIDCSLEALAAAPLLPHTTIVRALHHDETTVLPDNPASLDLLGEALASRFQSDYRSTLLHKSRLTRQIKGFSKEQRTAELRDSYYSEDFPGDGAILILDDILTTGATVKAILAALRTRSPRSSFSVFTLARATYGARPNGAPPLKGQNYQLEQGMDWILAEDPAGYYSAYSARQLMNWINAGDFP
jgi:predicted amidophosphoribosyltransferase